MKIEAIDPDDYIAKVPDDRIEAMKKIRQAIVENLPEGFEEVMSYGMIGYVVPHSIYPAGYHCDPKLPLPFMNLASQKNYIAFYHSGIYANPELLEWFVEKYKESCSTKLDMGKSCVRFKKMDQIPYGLIAELVTKISVKQWIQLYESR